MATWITGVPAPRTDRSGSTPGGAHLAHRSIHVTLPEYLESPDVLLDDGLLDFAWTAAYARGDGGHRE